MKEKIGEWSGNIEYNGEKASIAATLYKAEQSFGFQTHYKQVPVWFRVIQENNNPPHTKMTRSVKIKDKWIAQFNERLVKQS